MLTVLHLVDRGVLTPYFADIARHTDRSIVRLIVGSLDPPAGLQEGMRELGVETLSLDARRRTDWPRAAVRLASFLRKQRVDVVQGHLMEASLVGLTAARLAGTPVRVLTRHYADAVLMAGSRKALAAD